MEVAVDIKSNKSSEEGENTADVLSLDPTFWENFKQYVWQYCSRTSVYGLGYLGERGRTISERIFWITSIQFAVYLCTSLTATTYHKWTTSPAIVHFQTTQTPIWEIPFPAVTICPEIKSTKERYNFTHVYLKKKNNIELTEDEELDYQYMLLVCLNTFTAFDFNQSIVNESAINFLNEVEPNYRSIILLNLWMGSTKQKNFVPILTNQGICHTFNGLDKSEIFTDIVSVPEGLFSTNGIRSNWSLESGYLNNEKYSYPERTYISGNIGGLFLFLNLLVKDIDYACSFHRQGFTIMLHNPEEVPFYMDKYFQVPRSHSVTVAVKPNLMTTSDDLKNYNPAERQCYFPNEKRLKYFRVYNQANCFSECWIHIILETCGCVGFYMPRQKSTPICSAIKFDKCFADIIKKFGPEFLTDIELLKTNFNSTRNECQCLPSCTSLNFDYELSQNQWNVDDGFKTLLPESLENLQKGSNYSYVSKLNVFFKDMQFIKSERREFYGRAEFLAHCGGLLALYTGFSFISGLEILYYLTLRLACNLNKFGRRYWAGTEEILETMRGEDKM